MSPVTYIDPGRDVAHLRRQPGVPLHTGSGEVLFGGSIVARPIQLPNRRWIVIWPANGHATTTTWASCQEAADALLEHYTSIVVDHGDGTYRARCWCGQVGEVELAHPIEGRPLLEAAARRCPHGVDPTRHWGLS